MEYKDFLSLLMTYKKLTDDLSELHDIGFNFFEGKYRLMYHVEQIFETAISLHYTEAGVDWINWFIYENEYGQKDWTVYDSKGDKFKHPATDENGNPICYSFESLWNYIEEHHKIKKDNNEKS